MYIKIIAAQAIARKKGFRGNKAADGPADVGYVESNIYAYT